MVKLESKEDRGYVVQMAHDDYESGHPVEDFKEFASILRDDGIEATDSLWNIYLDNCCDESSQLTEDTQFKYIYRSNIEDPYDDYEKDLLGYDGQKCKIKKNLGNGNYEVEFEDGSEFDVTDDELEDIDFHGDNNGHSIEEGLVLKEAASSGYKVFTLAIDVAFPEGKTPRDYGVDSSVPGAQLFKELSKVLSSLGLEMAGDYVSQEAEVTDVYQDNEYEFFDEGLVLKGDSLEFKARV